MMRRREFITLLGGAAVAWPLAAWAQQPMPVIGYFSARSPVTDEPMLSAFRQGLNETGFVEGRNVAMEFRWAEGRGDRLLELAHNLVRRRVAVIITTGGESTARAVKAATSTIPVVFISGIDPVESGLVASLSRPGGNLTGVSSFLLPLIPKQIGLLSELAPQRHLNRRSRRPRDLPYCQLRRRWSRSRAPTDHTESQHRRRHRRGLRGIHSTARASAPYRAWPIVRHAHGEACRLCRASLTPRHVLPSRAG